MAIGDWGERQWRSSGGDLFGLRSSGALNMDFMLCRDRGCGSMRLKLFAGVALRCSRWSKGGGSRGVDFGMLESAVMWRWWFL